ncbi:MAG: hypothetical protein AAGC93_26565 [Cyanobacteria bacterium P01_F01_bin.53]
MSFSRTLRIIVIGLISLFGVLILIGVVAWFHDWRYGILNPDKITPEDWSLGLGVHIFVIQAATFLETLLISLVTRLRWIKFKQGKTAIGVFSLALLSLALPELRGFMSAPLSETLGPFLAYSFYLLLPVMPAWLILYARRARRVASK